MPQARTVATHPAVVAEDTALEGNEGNCGDANDAAAFAPERDARYVVSVGGEAAEEVDRHEERARVVPGNAEETESQPAFDRTSGGGDIDG